MKRSRCRRGARELIRAVFLAPLLAYRRWISPLRGPCCRYYPSCSTYAEQAIRELGIVKGTIVAAWRLVRCNPFSNGGVDHLHDRRLFRGSGDQGEEHPDDAGAGTDRLPAASSSRGAGASA